MEGVRLGQLRDRLRRSKTLVALSSVLAAVALTALKIVVGLMTGSLGILAEALHSALDLVAALLTLFAVRVSDRPADESHHYGHAKVENLAALAETLLLIATAGWVIYEAVRRLTGEVEHHVEPSVWAFAVMAFSIVVDYSRSRALHHAALEHDSQALAADALHFSTDMWSSAVVIVGLGAIALGERLGVPRWVVGADALAALVVAGVVFYASGRLARETVYALLDTAPRGQSARLVAIAEGVSGVVHASRVRLRRSGPKVFADMVVGVARTTTFTRAHEISDAVERAVRDEMPQADVVVHVEPVAADSETLIDRIHLTARRRGLRVHAVRVHADDGAHDVDLHLEVADTLALAEAHDLTSEFEAALREANPSVRRINSHLEAPRSAVGRRLEVTRLLPEMADRIRIVANGVAGAGSCHEVRIYREGDGYDLVLHCGFRGTLSIEAAHAFSSRIERAVRAELRDIRSVLVHAEPM